ncbi:hypothetical protein B566_EDAN012635 [Ephemera danica]|nr:hypothetical protein B566_EDAN012635 [Ephemera danica]
MTEYMDSRRGNRGYGHRSNDHGGRGGQQNFERQPSSYMPKPPAFGYRDRGQSSSFMSSNPPMRSSNRLGWDENTPSVPGHRVPYFLQTQPGEGKPQPVTLNFKEIFAQSERARLEKLAAMTPIIKDTYVESAAVARMTGEEAESFRAMKNGIKVHYIDVAELTPSIIVSTNTDPAPSGPKIPIPNPIRTFEEGFSMYPEIMQEIAKQGFTEPSPIQCQLWPCAMKGMDVVGIAQTGSGKTLAFLLPAMIHIQRQTTPREQRKSPTVLVLAPTRELAQQIDREVKKYSYKNIRSVCLYGGASRGEQIDALSIQTEIVIATPGHEMLDSGFEPQINKALLLVRGDRQTVLTSATWPESVRRMAKNYTKDPVMVVVGTTDIRAVESVKQNIIFLDSPDDRFDWIVDFLLKMNKQEKAIIFVGKKSLADHLSSELTLMNISVQCIHGSMCQEDREQNVNHVINHQFPKCVEQYVHRIGRTGRAGKLGESHTFIGRKDWSSAKLLIDILEHAKQDVPQELRDMAQRFENRRPGEGRGRGRGRGGFDRQSDGFGFGGNFSGGRGRDMYESARPPRHIETAQPIPAEIFDWGGEPPKIVSEGTEWVESEAESGQSTEWGVGAGYSQSSRGGGGYDHSSGGGSGYNQSSGGNVGYEQSSGVGYDQSSGGNVGYDQSSGGGHGYDQSSGGNAGYEQSSGGNVGYDQSSGSRGYGQSSGSRGYGQGSGGRGNAGWGRNSGTEWVQGSSRGRVWNRSSDREERPARDWGNRNSGERGRRGGGNWERNSGGGGEEWASGRGRARGQWNRNAGNQGCRYPN